MEPGAAGCSGVASATVGWEAVEGCLGAEVLEDMGLQISQGGVPEVLAVLRPLRPRPRIRLVVRGV